MADAEQAGPISRFFSKGSLPESKRVRIVRSRLGSNCCGTLSSLSRVNNGKVPCISFPIELLWLLGGRGILNNSERSRVLINCPRCGRAPRFDENVSTACCDESVIVLYRSGSVAWWRILETRRQERKSPFSWTRG